MQQQQALPAANHCGDEWLKLINDPDRIRDARPETVMPIFQGMMKVGCQSCPKEQTRVCQNLEKPLNVIGMDLVTPWLGMHWHFKAQDILAGGASDGGVDHDDVKAVIRATETTARTKGRDSVSLADFVETVGRLARDFAYREPFAPHAEFVEAVNEMGSPSKVIARGKKVSHARAAAYRSDPVAVRQNFEEIVAALPYEAKVHDMLAARGMNWCSHVPHLFTRLLWRTGVEDGELLELLDTVEAVAAERGHPGVTPRDVETALMRVAASGVAHE